MGNLVKSVNIFLSVFGLTLDCDSNIEKVAKVKIVTLNGDIVGEFINDYEEGSYKINVTTPSMNLTGRVYESRDTIGDFPGYSFDYSLSTKDERNIKGIFKVYTSPEDESKIHIRSELKYKEKNGTKSLTLTSNTSLMKFILEQDDSFIELSESGVNPGEHTYFHYIENAKNGCELFSKKVYLFTTCIPLIETSYTTKELPLDFPENALKAWKKLLLEGTTLKEFRTFKDTYQIEEDHRGNLPDVMNYARRKNPGFLGRIEEAEETLTIGDLHIFCNLMALTYHNFTPEERVAFFGSNYCIRKDTPIFSERGDLVLPQNRGKGSREHK